MKNVQGLFLVVMPILILIGLVVSDFSGEEVEEEKSEKEIVLEMLEDITFNTPPRISVLRNEQYVDKSARIRYNTLILKTDQEYLPKSPKNPYLSTKVMEELKADLPSHKFGEPMNKDASYSRFLFANAEWTVSWAQTDSGFYSKWVKKEDIHQLLREE